MPNETECGVPRIKRDILHQLLHGRDALPEWSVCFEVQHTQRGKKKWKGYRNRTFDLVPRFYLDLAIFKMGILEHRTICVQSREK